MNPIIDLRSDTVTQPTPEMRAAMQRAEVGDDGYGEDPTVNRLQELAAEMLGKQAGLLVVSGTMGNLVSILAQCGRGDEAILGSKAHTFLFEAGGISALGGVHSCQLPNQADGTLDLNDIRNAIRGDDPHCPVTRLVSLENTHNRCGGAALSLAYMQQVAELTRQHNLHLHLDGARLFNAAAALGVSARQLAEPADSVTICLSKGLCAPIGSVVCGTRDFIHRAHRARKVLGGGMRQAGVLAAAGIIALEKMTARLSEDHQRARRLAERIHSLPGIQLHPGSPQTNMIYIHLDEQAFPNMAGTSPTRWVAERLAHFGVKVGIASEHDFRLVLHYWIDDQAIDVTVAAFTEVANQAAALL